MHLIWAPRPCMIWGSYVEKNKICSPRTQKYDPFNNEKICFFFLETLYIDGIGYPDQVHNVCDKILEILQLEVFLGEFDKFGA